MPDPHTEKDEVDHLLHRIYGARAVQSRRINDAAMKLVDAACFSDTATIIEMARQIVEDSKTRNALIKWAEALKLAHVEFLKEHDTMTRAPEETAPVVLEGEHP